MFYRRLQQDDAPCLEAVEAATALVSPSPPGRLPHIAVSVACGLARLLELLLSLGLGIAFVATVGVGETGVGWLVFGLMVAGGPALLHLERAYALHVLLELGRHRGRIVLCWCVPFLAALAILTHSEPAAIELDCPRSMAPPFDRRLDRISLRLRKTVPQLAQERSAGPTGGLDRRWTGGRRSDHRTEEPPRKRHRHRRHLR